MVPGLRMQEPTFAAATEALRNRIPKLCKIKETSKSSDKLILRKCL